MIAKKCLSSVNFNSKDELKLLSLLGELIDLKKFEDFQNILLPTLISINSCILKKIPSVFHLFITFSGKICKNKSEEILKNFKNLITSFRTEIL